MILTSVILTLLMVVFFYFYTRPSLIERQIKQQSGNFECFECKETIHMDNNNCPHCELITYFGITRRKKNRFFIVIMMYVFAMASLWRKNQGFF